VVGGSLVVFDGAGRYLVEGVWLDFAGLRSCVWGGEAVSLSRKVFTTRIWRTRTTWIGSRCYMLPLRTTLAGVLHVGTWKG
jgi:hypothetical protein